ncbi:hypothetical protein FSP39_006734 [Pinctada imbricata]|uniref:Thioredoxin domain-containing protein n=1 Tax=Pinctada imbricata TaxID=66713 RepID=A0AA88XEU4_PINIB|nr:hypothetical protein FSP39_006734 [Pinctada imbricata]
MAKKLEYLLGEYLISSDSDTEVKVPVHSLCGKNRIIGIYFSADWCPPCKSFTPLLTEFYERLKKSNSDTKFEVVFVSWDKDENSFKDYFSQMPWLALPYDPEKKGKLVKKFRVQGIPKLVLLDGETGQTITCEGYSCLTDDKNGDEFPWRRKQFCDVIQGTLLTPERKEVDAMDVLRDKIVGLYFSAHWCPPCRSFTPQLVHVYQSLRSLQRPFEVVLVSSDRCQESFMKYFETMPWYAVPFGDPRITKLKGVFPVDGIPTLVVLDDKGEIITMNGRGAVMADEDCMDFPWYPKPVNELTGNAAVQLNESPCLVLFTGCDEKDIDDGYDALIESATEEHRKGEDQDLLFFFAADDEIVDSVRKFAHLDNRCPLLVVLDCPESKVYISPETKITKEVVRDFVQGYSAGTLEFKSLKL